MGVFVEGQRAGLAERLEAHGAFEGLLLVVGVAEKILNIRKTIEISTIQSNFFARPYTDPQHKIEITNCNKTKDNIEKNNLLKKLY